MNLYLGGPCEAVTQKNVENIRNILIEDPNKNIQELANKAGILVGSVCTVLHKELELHKVAAKWIPHVLTEEATGESFKTVLINFG